MTRDEIYEAFDQGLRDDPRIRAAMRTAEAMGLDKEPALMLVVVKQREALLTLLKMYADLSDHAGTPTRLV